MIDAGSSPAWRAIFGEYQWMDTELAKTALVWGEHGHNRSEEEFRFTLQR